MARRKKKRSQAARAQDAAEHGAIIPLKLLADLDFYALWNMCKKSEDYDVKAWVAAETKMLTALGTQQPTDATTSPSEDV